MKFKLLLLIHWILYGQNGINQSIVRNQSYSLASTNIGEVLAPGYYNVFYYAHIDTPCSTPNSKTYVIISWYWRDMGKRKVFESNLYKDSEEIGYHVKGATGGFEIHTDKGHVVYETTVAGKCLANDFTYSVDTWIGDKLF